MFKHGDVIRVEHDDLGRVRESGSLRGSIGTVGKLSDNGLVWVMIWSRPDLNVCFWPDELEHVRQPESWSSGSVSPNNKAS